MTNSFRDLTGKKIGRLKVLRLFQYNPVKWECLCNCGNISIQQTNHLTRKNPTKSCGCLRKEPRRRKLPYQWLYTVVKNSPKWVDLSFEEFLEFTKIEHCHYCEAPLVWNPFCIRKSDGRQSSSSYNLDCKDNAKGYTKANLVPCCARCNRAKMDHFSYEEWVQIGAVIRSFTRRMGAAA